MNGANQNRNPLVDALLAALSGSGQTQGKPLTVPTGVSMSQSPERSQGNPLGMTFSPQPGLHSPQMDLRPLIINAQRAMAQQQPQQTAAVQQAPMPQMQLPQTQQRQGPVLDDNGQTGIGRFLSRLGVPLATAGVGLAVPGALPAASNFQTGYVGEVVKDRELERKQKLNKGMVPIYERDANGELTIKGYAPKGAKVLNAKSGDSELDLQKEGRQRLSAMLSNNPQAQMSMIENPELYNQMLDSQVEILKRDLSTGAGVKQAQAKTSEVQGNAGVPEGVPVEAWNKATPQQKEEFLRKKYGG